MHFVWCGPVRAQNSMCKKKFEVVGGRADVPQDPAMAGGAAHSIRDCTRFLAKPKQRGELTVLPDSTLQTSLFAPEEQIVEIRSQGDSLDSDVADAFFLFP